MIRKSVLAIGLALVAGAAATALAAGEGHKMLTPDAITWGPAPASLPAGAEAAALTGNPAEEGLFAMRLRLPDGYHIPPHFHPKPEVVTVISGSFRLGMGETADEAKTEALPAGSFFAIQPEQPHFAFAEGETVVQLNSNGPWGLTYVNPEDDPRQQTQ